VTEKIEKSDKKKVPRETAEIRSKSVVEEEDESIEDDFLADWASPQICNTYPEEESLEKVNLSNTIENFANQSFTHHVCNGEGWRFPMPYGFVSPYHT
jgi:hypothetical protein